MPDRPDLDRFPELKRAWDRRQFIKSAAAGTALMAFGGALLKLARPRSVMLTGWAMDPSAPQGRGADLRLPLSDHADFAGLVEYARATGARRVFTVHGFCRELAEALQAQGVEAQALKSSTQLELF